MKRKLSLLIAAVMTLSLVPAMSVSAATQNKVIIGGGTVPKDYNWSKTDNVDETPFIQIKDDSGVTYSGKFLVKISNAKWKYSDALGKADGSNTPTLTPTGTITAWDKDTKTLTVDYMGTTGASGDTLFNQINGVTVDAAGGTGAINTKYTIRIINDNTAEVVIDGYKGGDVNWVAGDKDMGILIPMIVEMDGEGPATATLTSLGGGANISSGVLTFAVGGEGSALYTIEDDDTTFSQTLEVPEITISETVAGTLDKDGKVKLTAPNGFEWVKNPDVTTPETVEMFGGFTTAKVVETGSLEKTSGLHFQEIRSGYDDEVLVFEMAGNVKGDSSGAGIITFSNLQLRRSGSVSETPTGPVLVKVEATDGGSGTVQVGIFGPKGVTITAADKALPTVLGGIYTADAHDEEIRVLDVKITETSKGAWNLDSDAVFKLSDGVLFRGVRIDTDGIKGASDDVDLKLSSINGVIDTDSSAGFNAILEQDKLTVVDIVRNADDKIELEMQVYVSVKPGFTGDVKFMTDEDNEAFTDNEGAVVAKAINPFTVNAKSTDINLGYMNIPLGDFVIKENVAGALKRSTRASYTGGSQDIIMWVGGYHGNNSVGFKNEGKAEVLSGDIVIDEYEGSGDELYLTIKRESTKASEIKISGVTMDADRDIPEGKLDLRIGGSVVANYKGNAVKDELGAFDVSYFAVPGYVNVITAAPNKDVKYTTEVAVTVGQTTITANKVDFQMDVAPYNDNGYVMVPTRAVAVALGIDDSAVRWNPITKTVTIVDTNRNRTSQFTVGTDTIMQQGMPIYFDGPSCTVVNSRTFLPFRALGEIVLGCPVTWDQATQTAYFNHHDVVDTHK